MNAPAHSTDVLKTTASLADIDGTSEAYADYLDTEPSVRSAVQAGALSKGVAVEIEAVATVE